MIDWRLRIRFSDSTSPHTNRAEYNLSAILTKQIEIVSYIRRGAVLLPYIDQWRHETESLICNIEVYFTSDFLNYWPMCVHLPERVPYILFFPGWVIMYLSVLRLFPSRTQPGCIWVDHVFTYRSSDWHRVKRGSPSPARTPFLQVNPEFGFFYGLVWHWTQSLFWHHRETVTYYRYGK